MFDILQSFHLDAPANQKCQTIQHLHIMHPCFRSTELHREIKQMCDVQNKSFNGENPPFAILLLRYSKCLISEPQPNLYLASP